MNKRRLIFWIAIITIIPLLLFVVFVDIGIHGASLSGGLSLVMIELIMGFVPFLTHTLPAISFDAGTWGPGIAAYLAAMALGHRFLSGWAKRTKRPWSFATTFCLFLLVPVLFVISFLVPGVLLQWEFLRQGSWIQY